MALYSPQNLIFQTVRPDKLVKSAVFVEGTRKFVKEENIAGFQHPCKRGQNKERRGKKISVQMDHEPAGQIVDSDESRQGLLKNANFKTAPRICDAGNHPTSAEVAFRFGRTPPFG
jgi:hypothetical protein